MSRHRSWMSVSLLFGCSGSADVAAEQAPASVDQAPAPVAEAPAGPVTRIVFIGQEEACACTTKRIADVTTALAAALGPRQVAMETLYADHDQDQEAVEMYRDMRAFMVAPALFFFDAEGRLVDMTQGEVTQQELAKILGR